MTPTQLFLKTTVMLAFWIATIAVMQIGNKYASRFGGSRKSTILTVDKLLKAMWVALGLSVVCFVIAYLTK